MYIKFNTKFEVFAVICFLSYADNRRVDIITGTHTNKQTYTQTQSQTRVPNAKNVIFRLRGPQKVQIRQNLYFENLTQEHYFLY